jgi:biopolymer transport protein TolQ
LNLHPDLSFVAMVIHASVVVQAVMALLILASLWSWWQIFLKLFVLKRANRDTDRFEDDFWKGGDLNELFQRATQNRGGALERIFSSGFREYAKHRRQGTSSAATMDSARRAMRASYQREIDALEANLSGLATIGSVSPYVGLFGTVWGIMNAFRGLQNVSQATLAQVAPGIAEALIATAIGLFAAIPAVVAYNRYTHDVDRLATRFESFIEEFSYILQRQGLAMRRPRKSINQINVVPYIDVMLVLLVIFMVTAPLINPGVIELPSVGSQLAAPVAPLEISVRNDQSLWLRDGAASPVRVSPEELVARLRDHQARSPDQAVVIAADRAVRYEEVVRVLDLLQQRGVRKVGLLLRPQSS